MVDDEYNGRVVGLMGNFDGNSTNDFVLPNGTTLYGSDVDSERKIYNNFGQLWSIDSGSSLFHYDTGLSHANYTHPEFVPFYIDEQPQDKVNRSREVCGGASASQACIFDFLATGDESLAQSSGNDAATSERDAETLENEVPQITGDSQINAQVNQEVELKFNATDDGTYSYKIIQQPLGFTFDNGTGIAKWTPQDDSVTNISITVVDDKGEEAAPLDVAIVLCSGCSNHGACDYNTTRSSTSDMFKYAACNCSIGYSGQDCENNTDGCAASPCAQGRNCTDLSPEEEAVLGRGYNCSDCPAGYIIDDEKCEDINECNSTNTCNEATENCVNTEGSFECNCKDGFRKVGVNCQDIDECTESTSGCEQLCTNSAGSFQCSCISGYTLGSDNKTCTGESRCPGLNCEYACNNNTGEAPACICRTGYKLANIENCTDIDECELGGVCSQTCNNSIGSYTCSCYAGYQLNADKTTCSACEPPNYGVDCKSTCNCGKGMEKCDPVTGCVCKSGWEGSNCDTDIDECNVNPTICGSDKLCQNLEGSHACNCRTGFEKDSNDNCIDIDECKVVATNNCSSSTSSCVNKDGGFVCQCKSGYTPKNLYECEDIDECTAEIDGCNQNCVNVIGGFNCECEFGYTLGDDRKTCIRVQDICSLFPELNCTYGCKVNNSQGSCFCSAGFFLNAQDKQSCIDVDECNDASLNKCSFPNLCVNVDGSYNCTCPDFHTLDNDGRTCKECDGFSYGKTCENACDCGRGSSRCDKEKGCVCKPGWTGVKCDLDLDECAASNPCTGDHQNCQNSIGSYNCVCETGFKDDGSGNCKDIDECSDSPCSQTCTNTEGSYTCGCNDGFRLSGASECTDYDECLAPVSPCEQQCTNTIGSYKCSCNDGFVLDLTNRKTCNAKTECTNTTFNCSQKCGLKPGNVEYCFCDFGYSLNETDQINCFDIDECAANPCSDNCTENGPGQGYTCSCPLGKKLDIDQRTCIDCKNGTFGDNCASNCTCKDENTDVCDKVSGNCTCKPGWEGSTCTDDINECDNQTICQDNSDCQNTNGSYSCNCKEGYSLAAGQCIECVSNTYGLNCANQCSCDSTNTQSCDTKNGTCYCKEGWQGVNCTEDVLECSNTTICGPLATCSETNGSYVCNCNAGYKKDSSGSCVDIDECALGTDTCHDSASCTNTAGNFTCSCKVGFSGDGYSCSPCNNTHFGDGCSSQCMCIEENTVDCNDVTGECTCKTTWNGTNCDVDVNECDIGTHDCNSTLEICVNRDNGWNCTCRYGATNGACNDITTTANPETTTESTETSTDATQISTQNTDSNSESTPTATQSSDETSQSTQTVVSITSSSDTNPTTTGASLNTDSTSESTDTTAQSSDGTSQSTQPVVSTTESSQTSPATTGGSEGTTKVACNDTHYGIGCNQLCACNSTNTLDCDDASGTCNCISGWTGVSCADDVNECETNSSACNTTTQDCDNNEGGFSCVCRYGNSSAGCIEKEPAYTPEPSEVKLGVVLTFQITISLANYDTVKQTMTTSLNAFYKKRITGFLRVIILVIRKGSTIVEHEVVTNKTDQAKQDLVTSVLSLSKGESKVEYNNANLTTTSVSLTTPSGELQNITSASSKCDVYRISNPCGENEKCVEDNTRAYCTGIVDSSDNFQLIVGLGVGISLFVLAVLIGIIIAYFVRRKRQPREMSLSSSEDNFENTYGREGMYFTSGIPTKIDSWGRYGSSYYPHNWSGHDGKRGRDDFDDSTREPYMYDNGVQSNFSWDFMYQALQPNEKFQIKRPEVSPKPRNTE